MHDDGPVKLVQYDKARSALQAAHRIDEVKSIHDKAVALAAYARQAKDPDMVNWAMEIRVRAERRAGELLKAMPKNVGGNPKLTPPRKVGVEKTPDTLPALGISYNDSSNWQKLADIPEPEFEAQVAERKTSGTPLSTGALIAGKWTVAEVRQMNREARKQNLEEARQGKWDYLLWGVLLMELQSCEETIQKALVKTGYNEDRAKVVTMLKRLVTIIETNGGAS